MSGLTEQERARIYGTLADPDAKGSVLPIAMERCVEHIVAERERAAEQRGREDNADHGMCYVSGSEALAAKLADAFDEGKWAAYTAERDGLDGSEVHNFYRDRIENGQQS